MTAPAEIRAWHTAFAPTEGFIVPPGDGMPSPTGAGNMAKAWSANTGGLLAVGVGRPAAAPCGHTGTPVTPYAAGGLQWSQAYRWDRHCRLVGAAIVGLTPEGRATARLSHVNDPEHVELRAALIAVGQFPSRGPVVCLALGACCLQGR